MTAFGSDFMRRILASLGLLLTSACSERPAESDAFFFSNEGTVFIGAGGDDGPDVGLLCDPTGASDWPPLTVYLILPEAGEAFETRKRAATVDGREVPLKLEMKIDGRAVDIDDLWVQQHEGLQRAIIAGGVKNGNAVAGAIERARTVEFSGDGRRYFVDTRSADSRKTFADVCRAAAAKKQPKSARVEPSATPSTRSSNSEIEAAIVSHWRKGQSVYEANSVRYRIAESVETPDALSADAVERGIKAFPGIGLEAAGPPFQTVLVAYPVFDDPKAAEAYYFDADFNLGEQEVAEIKSFRIERPGYPVVDMRCVFVPSSDNSVNCHYRTPDSRIVAMLLFVGGPTLDFSGDERAIDLVFKNEAAADRVSIAASASWAYLYDAVYK